MKKFFVLIFLLTGFFLHSQEIQWMNFEEALMAQEKEPKKIVVDIYTAWCGYCKVMDRNTFQNTDVANYISEHYYAVKFNAEGNEVLTYDGNTLVNPNYDPAKAKGRNSSHQFSTYLRVSGYPTLVFFDEEGKYLMPLPGYKTPQQLELYLKVFGENLHKKFKSKEEFEQYSAQFKPEFGS